MKGGVLARQYDANAVPAGDNGDVRYQAIARYWTREDDARFGLDAPSHLAVQDSNGNLFVLRTAARLNTLPHAARLNPKRF